MKKRLIKAINECKEDELIEVLDKFVRDSKKPILTNEQKELLKKNMIDWLKIPVGNTGHAMCHKMVENHLENFDKLTQNDIGWLITCGMMDSERCKPITEYGKKVVAKINEEERRKENGKEK